MSDQSRVLFVCIFLGACGGETTPLVETSPEENLKNGGSFEGLANAALLATIDGMNLGDSSYAKVTERLLSETLCNDGGAEEQKTRASQWVNDETATWTARSLVSIEREYSNQWFQGGTALTCGQGLLDFQKIDQASFRLQSTVKETKRRQLTMTPKQGSLLERTDDLTLKATGTRRLEFSGYSEGSKSQNLSASLRSQMDYQLDLEDGRGQKSGTTFTWDDRSRLDFVVEVDKANGNWLRYEIPFSRLSFHLGADTSTTLILELKNLVWTNAGQCFPQSGQITVTRSLPSSSPETFVGTVEAKQDIVLSSTKSPEKLLLSPFACVLRER